MRILFLTHSFNSLTQRLFVELRALGHEVSVEFDISDSVAEEAVALFAPDLIIAPYLRRAIPATIWTGHVCFIVHPGVIGDRGPSALDWAIMNGKAEWGVTVLQANDEMDAGDVWASQTFPMRAASKSSLYRNEITEAAVNAVLESVGRYAAGDTRSFRPLPLRELMARDEAPGCLQPLLPQAQRAIDWQRDDMAMVLRKIHAADGAPGVRDELFGSTCHLHDARPAPACRGQPGTVLGRDADGGLVRATVDGAVRIGHVRRPAWTHPFKLPASLAFQEAFARLPEVDSGWREIRYEECAAGAVGLLHFECYNGAMSSAQCVRLLDAYKTALRRPTRVIVLCGGADFWSNGLHLNCIEAADSPADESWRNIEAMNDLVQAILETDTHLTVAALQGNAGAGGVFLALAADEVWARHGVIFNPHYRNMGNLHGSEYWTYTLPRRVGALRAAELVRNRLPLGAVQALRDGLLDACFGTDAAGFLSEVQRRAGRLAEEGFVERLAAKRVRRQMDEIDRPLAAHRAAELAEMRRNFYGFDPSYHVARYHFVHKLPLAWTPRHLARHRSVNLESAGV